ncbi:MAG: TetR/AcrR family transcriptional regulator [Caulobacter sp.]
MSDRLTKADWIRHGLLTLAKHGPAGLKVGPMAEALKVSRGSFYWHFKDIADFRARLLQGWREVATDQVIQDLDGTAAPDRFRRLMRRAFGMKLTLERAVRAWAAEDRGVAAAVAAVDARRIGHIAALLAASGVNAERAEQRATFLYWAFLGQGLVSSRRHAALTGDAMDEISGLFEG